MDDTIFLRRDSDCALAYAHQTFESAFAVIRWAPLGRGEPFPAGAVRACLLHGREMLDVVRRTAAFDIGFEVIDGLAFGVDHCNGPAIVVF